MQSKHLQDILPLFFRRKTLYGSLSSRLLATGISIMSGCLRNAHLNLVFHVDGSGCSPGLYLPVCSAHMRNSTASWSRLKSGFPACFHVTRNFVFSLSIQCSPGTSPLSIRSSSQGRSRCRSDDMRKKRSLLKPFNCHMRYIYGSDYHVLLYISIKRDAKL